MRWATLGALTIAAGCTYATLSDRGRGVNVADAAPAGCESLGIVIGKGGGGGGFWVPNERLVEYALNDARNKAAELGGTHVTLSPPQLGGDKSGTTSATIMGLAYRCAQATGTPAGTERLVPAAADPAAR